MTEIPEIEKYQNFISWEDEHYKRLSNLFVEDNYQRYKEWVKELYYKEAKKEMM